MRDDKVANINFTQLKSMIKWSNEQAQDSVLMVIRDLV
jgi:hypothetical protein